MTCQNTKFKNYFAFEMHSENKFKTNILKFADVAGEVDAAHNVTPTQLIISIVTGMESVQSKYRIINGRASTRVNTDVTTCSNSWNNIEIS